MKTASFRMVRARTSKIWHIIPPGCDRRNGRTLCNTTASYRSGGWQYDCDPSTADLNRCKRCAAAYSSDKVSAE